jgi:hypothetical protein
MKLFIKNIILFSLVSIGVILLIQIMVDLRIKDKTVRGHDNLDVTSDVNADLVLLGSSRCWAHFDPTFFKETFGIKSANIGVDGHTEIAITILRLKNYLSKNNAPKYAILSLDPFVRSGNEKNSTNLTHKDVFSRYAFFPNKKNEAMVDHFKFDYSEKYVPLYAIFKYKMFVDCLTLQNSGDYTKYGFEKHVEKWDTIAKPITNILKKSFYTKKEEPSIVTALSELNQLCVKNNIKLLCIQTPVYQIIQDDKIFNATALVCKKLNIPFVDVNVKPIQQHIGFFYNSNHLNNKGVEEMNLYLKKDPILNGFLNQ